MNSQPCRLSLSVPFLSRLRSPFTCFALLTVALLLLNAPASAQFLTRDLMVARIGTGSAALTSGGTAVFIDRFSTIGILNSTIALPTVDSGLNKSLVSSGTATSEGALTLSTDGQYLVYAGYNASVGTATVASSTVARVIARIDSAGKVDTTTALTDAYSANNIRSVVTTDGVNFWAGGTGTTTSGGVRYTTLGSTTSTQLSTTVTNIRNVNIAFGQLYASSASGAFIGVNSVGVGLPTTSGQTTSLLTGFSGVTNLSTYDYVLASPNVLYVADDGASASANRGLQKWVYDGTSWTLAYKVTGGLTTGGIRGLTASIDNGIATLYATTTETSANKVVTLTDGLTATSNGNSFTVVTTAPANTVFRGIDFAPKSNVQAPGGTPEPGGPALALVCGGLLALLRARRSSRR